MTVKTYKANLTRPWTFSLVKLSSSGIKGCLKMMVAPGEICTDFLAYLSFDKMVLILLANDHD